MIPITELKEKVQNLISELTDKKVFYDVVPTNIKTGCLIIRGITEFTGRTIDGEAHVAHHSFDVVIFSFDGAEVCDELTSNLVLQTDGKCSQDFRLIEVNSITPTEYDPEVGFWANSISIEFVER